ncbi:MAG: helicase C-terminal domain-containing protein [Christensenellales bacterium]
MLAVLGGAFAEGIDLAGERLENVIVVSTGLPQPDVRVRAMQRYHDESGADGYFLCMTLPGMVRVIQAAGRLIRTESDRGALLLIDSRYQRRAERELLSGTLIGEALSG